MHIREGVRDHLEAITTAMDGMATSECKGFPNLPYNKCKCNVIIMFRTESGQIYSSLELTACSVKTLSIKSPCSPALKLEGTIK